MNIKTYTFLFIMENTIFIGIYQNSMPRDGIINLPDSHLQADILADTDMGITISNPSFLDPLISEEGMFNHYKVLVRAVDGDFWPYMSKMNMDEAKVFRTELDNAIISLPQAPEDIIGGLTNTTDYFIKEIDVGTLLEKFSKEGVLDFLNCELHAEIFDLYQDNNGKSIDSSLSDKSQYKGAAIKVYLKAGELNPYKAILNRTDAVTLRDELDQAIESLDDFLH